jgi:two-component system, LuxR family, response regulator FixJ
MSCLESMYHTRGDVITPEDHLVIDEGPASAVVIVDDDDVIRQLLCSLIRSAGFTTEAYCSAEEFLEHFDDEKVGCLILDIGLPGIDGMELQQRLKASGAGPPIVFVTGNGEIPLATEALRAGAIDFLTKPCNSQLLLNRIREALDRHKTSRLRRASAADAKRRIMNLTARELEIMELLAAGDSPKKIAAQLSICIKTVDNHRLKIFEKMHVENSTQLSLLLVATRTPLIW